MRQTHGMVEISIEQRTLVLDVQGSHKLWALKSRLEIPLANVRQVYADPTPAMGWFDGLKLAGTDVPNVFRAGLFWLDGERVFYDVRNPQNTIVIELAHERYAKLIVEVEDPKAAVNQIQAALAHKGAH